MTPAVGPTYRGNRQYISVGNLSENDRAFLFLMDYPNRRRVKIWGRAELIDKDDARLDRLVAGDTELKVERGIVFHEEAWDSNCPQHITPRFTAAEIEPVIQKLRDRIAELESKVPSREGQTAAELRTER